MPDVSPRVLFGAAYYHEYQPYERLKTDLDLMVGRPLHRHPGRRVGLVDLGAGERTVRPRLAAAGPGRRPRARHRGHPRHADLRRAAVAGPAVPGDRRRARDRAAHRLGRPAGGRLHPSRVPVPRRAGHPARSSPGTPTIRRSSASRSTTSPATSCCTTTASSSASSTTCGTTYGDVETLNREWGLVYWSHRLSTWADLWTPDGNVQPQYDVAWRRFQAEQTTEFIGWQADIVREYARPDQFVTTCISYERPAVDDDALTEPPRRHRRQPVLRHAGRPGAARPGQRAAALDDHRARGRCT